MTDAYTMMNKDSSNNSSKQETEISTVMDEESSLYYITTQNSTTSESDNKQNKGEYSSNDIKDTFIAKAKPKKTTPDKTRKIFKEVTTSYHDRADASCQDGTCTFKLSKEKESKEMEEKSSSYHNILKQGSLESVLRKSVMEIMKDSFTKEDPSNSSVQESPDDTKKNVEEDVIATIVGDFGRWQLIIGLLMSLIKLPVAWYQLNIIFLAPPQDYWCTKPNQFYMLSDSEWRLLSTPVIEEHACLIFDPDILAIFPTMDKRMLPLVECKNFTYSHSIFNSTIVSEWNLVCSRHWYVHFCQVELMWGVLVGGLLFGIMADRHGRKTSLMTAILIQSSTALISGLIPWFWLFLINRFFLALATGGIAIVSFVISMEVVSGKWRTIIPVLCQLPFGIGNTVMAVLAYYLRNWRLLELSLGALTSLFVFCHFYVPESPRWLMATGQTEKAVEVLKKAAKVNKRKFEQSDMDNVLATKPKSNNTPHFLAFISKGNMRIRTILLSLNWFITGLSYYTFAQYLGYIGSNIFVTVAVSGLIATPGGIICIYVVLKKGRKGTIAGFQLLTSLCFVCLLFVPKGVYTNDWPRLMFAGLGMAGMAGSVPALYLLSAELYPTIGRNVGVGGVTLFARLGSMTAPLLVGLDEIVVDCTLIMLALLSLGQILLIVPLPETKNCPLLATLEEAEKFGTRKSYNFTFKNLKSSRTKVSSKDFTTLYR